jgi:hypothetical protein
MMRAYANNNLVFRIRKSGGTLLRPAACLYIGGGRHCRLAGDRSDLRLQRHVALVINTGTTIITFLMVFLIQNTQNRDTEAIQVKLDELIRATNGAHNALLDLEELEQGSLDAFKSKYQALATAARVQLKEGTQDTGTPEP